MSQAAVPLQHPHPYQRCVSAVGAAVDEACDGSPIYLSPDAKREVLIGLSRQIARLEGMRLATLAASGDVAEEDAARSAGAWLAVAARLDRPEGRRLQRLAEALDERWVLVAEGVRAGDVSRPQAEAIAAALDALPDDVDRTTLDQAERHLVEHAAEFGPRELRLLGRRILDVVAPEIAEEHERQALEAAERAAHRRMRVARRDLDDGLVRITADLPVLHADLLWTQLHAYASPRRDHLERVDRRDPESGERVTYPRLLAQGFCSLLERLPSTSSPAHGGDSASLVVTIDEAKLSHELGVARLGTGNAISAGEARRLACNAGILPMVLDGKSRPLDVGRRKRFHTPPMRRAMAVRDLECRAQGCDVPAAWCEAHHRRAWADLGPTNVDDGVLLCGYHHRRAHDPKYDATYRSDGAVTFHRRP